MLVDAGLLTGFDEIDRQHRKIFEKTNELVEANAEGASYEVVQAYLDFLTDFVGRHFSTEEAIMAALEYPDLPLHREEHAVFHAALRKMAASYIEHHEDRLATQKTVREVVFWVKEHILGHDHKMAKYLREKLTSAA